MLPVPYNTGSYGEQFTTFNVWELTTPLTTGPCRCLTSNTVRLSRQAGGPAIKLYPRPRSYRRTVLQQLHTGYERVSKLGSHTTHRNNDKGSTLGTTTVHAHCIQAKQSTLPHHQNMSSTGGIWISDHRWRAHGRLPYTIKAGCLNPQISAGARS